MEMLISLSCVNVCLVSKNSEDQRSKADNNFSFVSWNSCSIKTIKVEETSIKDVYKFSLY